MSTEEDIIDYEEEVPGDICMGTLSETPQPSIHSSGFRDLLLKPELLRAIKDRGYEHPSQGKSTRRD